MTRVGYEWQDDPEFREFLIEAVDVQDDWVDIKFDKGMACGVERKHLINGYVPQVGDTFRDYSRGFGSMSRGRLFFPKDSNEVYLAWYRTPEEADAKHERWKADWEQEQRESYRRSAASIDAKRAALPEAFKKRLDRFERTSKDFVTQSLPYELFCCTEAVVLADALKTSAEVERFQKLDYTEQKKLVPQLAHDEHSGNTYGGMIHLAYHYLEGHDL